MQDSGPMQLLQALSEGLTGLVQTAARSVVRVQARPGVAGTGIVWNAEGLILTADHVLQQEEEITVGLPDGRSLAATLVGKDQRTDLALLRVSAGGLAPLPLAEGDEPRPATLVVAVGRPGAGGPIASMGVVSALGPLGGWRGGPGEEVIYSNVVLYPGFSGGPLLDARGRVLGMNTSTFGRGVSVAIPIAVIQRVLDHLLASGRVRRGYLGITSQPVRLPPRLSQDLGLAQEAALLVLAVEPESPADRAGLLLGDVLVGINGRPVRSSEDLLRALAPELVGNQASLRVVRGGRPLELTALVAERPAG